MSGIEFDMKNVVRELFYEIGKKLRSEHTDIDWSKISSIQGAILIWFVYTYFLLAQ